MVVITLPDGSVREFDGPVTGLEIAQSIGPRLAKDALAIKVNGALRDLSRAVEQDAPVEIVTRGHGDALELLRHDCAHVMAEAVLRIFPDAKIVLTHRDPTRTEHFYALFRITSTGMSGHTVR